MTNDELVDVVARAICREYSADSTGQYWGDWTDLARAAIAVVVEECARVAEQPVADRDRWNNDGYVTKYQAPPCVATVIRALKQGGEE